MTALAVANSRTGSADVAGKPVEGPRHWLQRKCACGSSSGLAGSCPECERKKMFGLQTKLTIGAVDDPFEREADQMAERIVAMSGSANNVAPSPGQKVSRLTSISRLLPRTDDTLPFGGEAPDSVQRAISAPGEPLAKNLRDFFEPRFVHDFSQVRVHFDAAAARSARDVAAQAYTVGRHVVFDTGRYAPMSATGRTLLAHELTHVVQQSAAPETADTPAVASSGPARLQRQEVPQPAAAVVTSVQISCSDRRIVFNTSNGVYSYALTECSVPVGSYNVGVHAAGATVRFEFGAALGSGQAFRFGFRVDFGQANPVTLIGTQRQVAVEVVEHLPAMLAEASHAATPAATVTAAPASMATRLIAFKQLIKNAGKVRLEQNSRALEQWRQFLRNELTPRQIQGQVHAEEVRSLVDRAEHAGQAELSVADQWLQTPGANRRWVMEQQIEGRFHACTGCHAAVQADALDRTRAEHGVIARTPLQQLSGIDASAARPDSTQGETLPRLTHPGMFPAVTQATDRVNAVQPYLRVLGPGGYHVLPPETLGSTASPSQLLADIEARITGRQAGYSEFMRRIDAPNFDYLQLRPIVRDLLPLADAQVRRAVLDEIDDAETWETVQSVVVGVVAVGLLLLTIFPPTTALGIGGALALGGTLSAHAAYSGMQSYEQGQLYALGRGANDVLDPAQQEAAEAMMAMGALNVVVGAMGVASSALGSVRLIRALPPAGGGVGAVEAVEGQASGTLYRVTGWGTRDPQVVVTSGSGQVVRQGPLSSFGKASTGGPRASAGPSMESGGGSYVYATEGSAARVAQPVTLPEPVPLPQVQPASQPATTLGASPPLASPRLPLTITAASGVPDTINAATGPSAQPVMPQGLSRSQKELWRECAVQHDRYKATGAEQAALNAPIQEILQRLRQNSALPNDRLEFCALLNQRVALVQRLQRERRRYMEMGCDQFDWFQQGTTAAQRLSNHQAEENNVRAQLANIQALIREFCAKL